jgi:hypothetical protein
MSGAMTLTQSDMELRFGADYVRQVFGDDGSGRAGARLAPSLLVARRTADAILMTAWAADTIEKILDEDDAVRAAVLDLAMSEGMAGRPTWDFTDGPRSSLRKAGIESLKLLADGERRSISETVSAGTNPHTRKAKVNTVERVFAPTREKPIRGGF